MAWCNGIKAYNSIPIPIMASRSKYLFGISVCLIVIVSLVGSFGDLGKADRRIREARDEFSGLKKEEQKLLRRKREVDSPAFVEQEARNRLGLAKPGETVVILPDNLKTGSKAAEKDTIPNWEKWWRLLL